MAISFVGRASGTNAGNGLTVGRPVGIQTGDLAVVVHWRWPTSTPDIVYGGPSGFTYLAGARDDLDIGGTTGRMDIWYRRVEDAAALASEPAWTLTRPPGDVAGGVEVRNWTGVYRGVRRLDPVRDYALHPDPLIGGEDRDPPAYTSGTVDAVAGDWLVSFIGVQHQTIADQPFTDVGRGGVGNVPNFLWPFDSNGPVETGTLQRTYVVQPFDTSGLPTQFVGGQVISGLIVLRPDTSPPVRQRQRKDGLTGSSVPRALNRTTSRQASNRQRGYW